MPNHIQRQNEVSFYQAEYILSWPPPNLSDREGGRPDAVFSFFVDVMPDFALITSPLPPLNPARADGGGQPGAIRDSDAQKVTGVKVRGRLRRNVGEHVIKEAHDCCDFNVLI